MEELKEKLTSTSKIYYFHAKKYLLYFKYILVFRIVSFQEHLHLFYCRRPCPPACKPNACVCKLKNPPETNNIAAVPILTPCEEKENNGFAVFYSDESDGMKICDTIYFKATRPNLTRLCA